MEESPDRRRGSSTSTHPWLACTRWTGRRIALLIGVSFLLLVGAPIGYDVAFAGADASEAADAGTAGEAETAPDAGRETGPPDAGEKTTASRLLEEADAIAEQVARIRGLPTLESIDKGVRDRDELRELLVQELEEEQSRREMEREAAVLKKLGLVPRDLDYRSTLLDVLTEQIAGFYDQKRDQLNIVDGVPLDLQRPAMAHEIFHAIQDQHFDLTRMMEPFSIREHGDFHLARSALVEGDATVLMIDYTLYRRGTLPRSEVRSIVDIPMMAKMLEQLDYGELGALEKLEGDSPADPPDPSEAAESANPPGMSGSALEEAPAILRRGLIFPYLAGMQFVIALRAGRTWEEFDEVYDRPPVSTEQILHPERYAARDEPVVLTYGPGATLESFDEIYDTVLGEFQTRLFLEEHTDASSESGDDRSVDVAEATTGWDGDRLYGFRDGEGRVLVTHLSVWDSTRDAVEYYDALVEVNERRFPDAAVRTSSGEHGSSTCLRADDERGTERIYMERWGDAVLHIEGAPTNLEDEVESDPTTYLLRERVWNSLERKPFREVYRKRMAEQTDESEDSK